VHWSIARRTPASSWRARPKFTATSRAAFIRARSSATIPMVTLAQMAVWPRPRRSPLEARSTSFQDGDIITCAVLRT